MTTPYPESVLESISDVFLQIRGRRGYYIKYNIRIYINNDDNNSNKRTWK